MIILYIASWMFLWTNAIYIQIWEELDNKFFFEELIG